MSSSASTSTSSSSAAWTLVRRKHTPFPEAAASAFGRSSRAGGDYGRRSHPVEFDSNAASAFGRPSNRRERQPRVATEFDERAATAFGGGGRRSREDFSDSAAFGGGDRKYRGEGPVTTSRLYPKIKNNLIGAAVDAVLGEDKYPGSALRRGGDTAAPQKTEAEAFPTLGAPARAIPVAKPVGGKSFAELMRERAAQDEAEEAARKLEEIRRESENRAHEREVALYRRLNTMRPAHNSSAHYDYEEEDDCGPDDLDYYAPPSSGRGVDYDISENLPEYENPAYTDEEEF